MKKQVKQEVKTMATPSTYKQWEDVVKGMSQEDKDRFIDALNTLQDWSDLRDAFDWTGIFKLKNILIWN